MEGREVSHYRVTKKIGEGGMGVVYAAEDQRLQRAVAIKFLPEELARSEEARSRFEREARAAAALNHPNICTIHDVGAFEGRPFLVMELLEGESLRGPLPEEAWLGIAMQLAEGLAAAHAEGVVHRDLKPANVLVTGGGHVTILDFGLAKLFPRTGGKKESSLGLTDLGSPLGTPQYMSPEQALGRELDRRTDIFSLGAVLYEIAAGHPPFRGDTAVGVIDAILNQVPPPLANAEQQRIVAKALEKDADHRYQTAKGLLADLRRLRRDTESAPVPVPVETPPRARRWPFAAAAVAVLAALAVVLWPRDGEPESPSSRTVPAKHTQLTFVGTAAQPAISPDGKSVAYVETLADGERLLVRDLAGGEALQVFEGQVGGMVLWSPDGTELVMAGGRVIPRLGGAVRDHEISGLLAWSPDGNRILGTTRNALWILDRATGEKRRIEARLDWEWFGGVDWSPLGDTLAALTLEGETWKLWTIGTDGTGLRVILVEDTPSEGFACPRFSPDGKAVYVLRTAGVVASLLRVELAAAAAPAVLVSGLQVGSVPLGYPRFSISGDGRRLVYRNTLQYSNLWIAEPPDFRTRKLTDGTRLLKRCSVSPEGDRLAFTALEGDASNLFTMPIAGGARRQLTFSQFNSSPAWSPDGKTIAFASTEGGRLHVWTVPAEGGTPRRLSDEPVGFPVLAWAPGPAIVHQTPGIRSLVVLDPETGKRTKELFAKRDRYVEGFCWAPDGKRLAVRATRRGNELLVTSIEEDAPRVLMKTKETLFPIGWSPDGRRVYAVRVLGKKVKIISVAVENGNSQPVLELPFEYAWYDLVHLSPVVMTPDARRFVFPEFKSSSDIWLIEDFDPAFAR